MRSVKKIVCMLAIAGMLCLVTPGIITRACSTDVSQVLGYMNQFRAEKGLGPLTFNDSLTQAAHIRAKELKTRFSHTRPDGSAWYTAGANLCGENLARAENEEQSRSLNVAYAWYISPGHSDNLLSGYYTQVGISYYEEAGYTYIACEFR
ncbi:MAG: hypothetical protein E7301_10515 [Butyrivibrio sp.]|nr:hypothetical protein [Butyrivibrio sp.]